MIRRPPRSTLSSSSAASDVYKRQEYMGQSKLNQFNQYHLFMADPNMQQPLMYSGQQQQPNPYYPQQQPYQQQPPPYYQGSQMQQQAMPGQPVLMGAPQGGQQMVMAPTNAVNFMNAMDKLNTLEGVFVKQKFDLAEVILGCEIENKYTVFAANSSGEKLKKVPIFKAKEKSGCLERNCLAGNCRPFKVKVEHDAEGPSSNDGQHAFRFNREYELTCCCLNRPNMEVFLTENNQDTYLGKVNWPFNCCSMELEVFDAQKTHIYNIYGDICQLGVWCRFPCESCQRIEFSVRDPNTKQELSQLVKKSQGCIKAAISDADNFSLVFPKGIEPAKKALLMAATIMLDFSYFEENPRNRNNQQGSDLSFF
eukprot:TRINITY_DN5673_c0_g1_i4.p1 TRINITY_DN5673_c0_g1~~TRINITY_DN5673_c0_g1_i4.p1  ORF type:complete len:366 (-),score=59.20 TRINITY_DN5673_c0_g1_i4:42-1139(-)